MLAAGLAEMHLSVDHPRQHVQTAGIKYLAAHGLAEVADGRNAPVADAHVARANAVVIDQNATTDDEIEGFGNDRSP